MLSKEQPWRVAVEKIVISGTGLYTPPETISNEEIVSSFNEYVEQFNRSHQAEIEAGEVTALLPSDTAFVVKASGIKNRYVMNKAGILNTKIMCPQIPARSDEEVSLQCEIAVAAAKQAMQKAKKTAADIDGVITSATNLQRPYPAIAIEAQNILGIQGFGYDMSVGCSSVTFGIQAAVGAILTGVAKCVLLLNPELLTPQVDFRDRESHFIFGEAATAMIIEKAETCRAEHAFEIVDVKLQTQFSNNIRCNFGYLNRAEEAAGELHAAKLFKQQGRKVFREVVPMVEQLITEHLASLNIKTEELKRLWLHQANSNMDRLIATKVLGYEPDETKVPMILDEYANTASAGVSILFHKFHEDLKKGDLGILCSFGAGYSIGNVVLRKYS